MADTVSALVFFSSSRRRHTRFGCDWSSDVCSSDLRELALPPAGADRTVAPAEGGYRVTVTARTLLRDVAVLADRAAPAAEVDDMLVTLLPGEDRKSVV